MKSRNFDTRIHTAGSAASPQPLPITSEPQLVTPITTGPWGPSAISGPALSPPHRGRGGPSRIGGPPLSPPHGCVSVASPSRSWAQMSRALTAFGYDWSHVRLEISVRFPDRGGLRKGGGGPGASP